MVCGVAQFTGVKVTTETKVTATVTLLVTTTMLTHEAGFEFNHTCSFAVPPRSGILYFDKGLVDTPAWP